jgi:SAM-dependent methyltransferase
MGINYLDARIMWEARQRGVSFDTTLSVAHLSLALDPRELRRLREEYLARMPGVTTTPLDGYQAGDYSDAFIRGFLGASALSVLDYSPYEGATIVHDLNQPLPAAHHGQFDAVIDGGSLEHVFNFPVAIASLMRALKVGGHLFLKSPANNLCGHGFYQFSPELMFRIFSEDNGFEIRRVLFMETALPVETRPYRAAYEVIDPKAAGGRVTLTSDRPIMMLVEARKIANLTPFASSPLQGDYVEAWRRGTSQAPGGSDDAVLRAVFTRLPRWLQSRLRTIRQIRRDSLSNPRFYRRLPY